MGETSGVHQPPFLHPDLPIQCALYTISRISFLKFYSNPITLLFKIWFQWFPLYLVKISLYVYKDCLYKDLNNNHYLGGQIFKLILNMNPGSRQHPPQLTAQKTQLFLTLTFSHTYPPTTHHTYTRTCTHTQPCCFLPWISVQVGWILSAAKFTLLLLMPINAFSPVAPLAPSLLPT